MEQRATSFEFQKEMKKTSGVLLVDLFLKVVLPVPGVQLEKGTILVNCT